MRLVFCISLIILVTSSGCGTPREPVNGSQLTAAQKHRIEDSVKHFVLDVAHDVSQEGPTAWRRHFADSPAFFMAVNGHLVFPNSQSATEGIQNFAHTVQHIDLHGEMTFA